MNYILIYKKVIPGILRDKAGKIYRELRRRLRMRHKTRTTLSKATWAKTQVIHEPLH